MTTHNESGGMQNIKRLVVEYKLISFDTHTQDGTRTRSFQIRSLTRYHCATRANEEEGKYYNYNNQK